MCAKITLTLLLIFPAFYAFPQKKSYTFFDVSLHYGFIIVHSKDLSSVKNSYPFGIDIGAGKQFVSRKAYEFCRCEPKLGFNLQLWEYGNSDVLGRGAFFNFKVETPFRKGDEKFFPSASFGTGLVYNSNPYDEIENPDNLSYSTNLSFSLHGALALNYNLSPKSNLFLAANYNHSSNGGRKQPNKGINFPTASVGFSYYPKAPVRFDHPENLKSPIPDKKNYYELRTFATSKKTSSAGDAEYFIGGFEALYARWVGGVHNITLSTEWIWDTARKKRMELSGKGDKNYLRSGLLAGHEFQLGRFIFRQSAGIYIYETVNFDDAWYQRYSLHYNPTGPFHLSLGIKSHRHVADFLDLGVSCRL